MENDSRFCWGDEEIYEGEIDAERAVRPDKGLKFAAGYGIIELICVERYEGVVGRWRGTPGGRGGHVICAMYTWGVCRRVSWVLNSSWQKFRRVASSNHRQALEPSFGIALFAHPVISTVKRAEALSLACVWCLGV